MVTALYRLTFLAVFITLFVACENKDGEIKNEIIVESPYYLKLKQNNDFIDVRHGLTQQAKTNYSYNAVICDWLFNDCTVQPDTFYFASAFGPANEEAFNFVITNFPYSSVDDTSNLDYNSLLDNLPLVNGKANLAKGTLDAGINAGQVYIGKTSFKYGYAYTQPDFSEFKILETSNAIFNNSKVVDITFTFEYRAYDDAGNFVVFGQGEGKLPFGLHGQD